MLNLRTAFTLAALPIASLASAPTVLAQVDAVQITPPGPGSSRPAAPATDETRSRARVAESLLSVQGSATASRTPDQAVVTLGVMFTDESSSAAQHRVNTSMERVIDAIQKLGIPDAKMQSSQVSLNANIDYRANGEQRVKGYTASNNVRITLDKPTDASRVIDAGLAAGANTLQGVYFTLKNEGEAKREALRGAAREAREKANALAEALGVRIVALREVSEEGAPVRPLIMARAATFGVAADASAPTPVESGEIEVRASVTLVYEISESR